MARVALIGDNSIEYVSTLLDIWNAGDCAVLIDWRIPFQTAHEMMIEANVSKCCIESKVFSKIRTEDYPSLTFEVYNNDTTTAKELPKSVYKKFRENYSVDEAVVIYSSGTTGKSKGIVLSHYAISTNADAILDYMELKDDDCIYIVKSLTHSSTLTGELLVSLKSSTRLIIAPPIVPPRLVFANIKKFNVTTLCLNPTLLQLYTTEYQRNKFVISTLKTIYVSGSILNDSLYVLAHETFGKVNIFNVYGLSEAGPRVTAQRTNCCKSNSVGKPLIGVEIVIVDDMGNPVKQGERGVIHVNTSSKYMYYICGEEKFRSLYNGWLNTGNVGYVDNNGELHIAERKDDVIIINSHKIYPSDIERLLLSNDKVIDCCITKCTANEKEFIGCAYVSNEYNETDIIRILKCTLLPYEMPSHILKVTSIPKNERGKVNKHKVKMLLLRNYHLII